MVFHLGRRLWVLEVSFLAYVIEDLDLSSVTNYVVASPFSADFVVDGDGSGALSAMEFYVKSMVDCARRVGHGAVVGKPIARVTRLPNDDEVLRQLPRKVSKRNVDNKASFDMHRQQEVIRKPYMDASAVGRSFSVGLGKIGRIDEDKPCYFEEDDVNVKSRSYGVNRN